VALSRAAALLAFYILSRHRLQRRSAAGIIGVAWHRGIARACYRVAAGGIGSVGSAPYLFSAAPRCLLPSRARRASGVAWWRGHRMQLRIFVHTIVNF
jgi:hypothetical protein